MTYVLYDKGETNVKIILDAATTKIQLCTTKQIQKETVHGYWSRGVDITCDMNEVIFSDSKLIIKPPLRENHHIQNV